VLRFAAILEAEITRLQALHGGAAGADAARPVEDVRYECLARLRHYAVPSSLALVATLEVLKAESAAEEDDASGAPRPPPVLVIDPICGHYWSDRLEGERFPRLRMAFAAIRRLCLVTFVSKHPLYDGAKVGSHREFMPDGWDALVSHRAVLWWSFPQAYEAAPPPADYEPPWCVKMVKPPSCAGAVREFYLCEHGLVPGTDAPTAVHWSEQDRS